MTQNLHEIKYFYDSSMSCLSIYSQTLIQRTFWGCVKMYVVANCMLYQGFTLLSLQKLPKVHVPALFLKMSHMMPTSMSVCISACLSAYQHVCLSICLPVYLPVCLFVYMPVCLPASQPACQSAFWFLVYDINTDRRKTFHHCHVLFWTPLRPLSKCGILHDYSVHMTS